MTYVQLRVILVRLVGYKVIKGALYFGPLTARAEERAADDTEAGAHGPQVFCTSA